MKSSEACPGTVHNQTASGSRNDAILKRQVAAVMSPRPGVRLIPVAAYLELPHALRGAPSHLQSKQTVLIVLSAKRLRAQDWHRCWLVPAQNFRLRGGYYVRPTSMHSAASSLRVSLGRAIVRNAAGSDACKIVGHNAECCPSQGYVLGLLSDSGEGDH